MAAYIYTIKDRESGKVLFSGREVECSKFLGTDPKTIYYLVTRDTDPKKSYKFGRYKVERELRADAPRGGDRRKDTVCCDCGIPLPGVGAKRKRCPDCAEKRKMLWHVEHRGVVPRGVTAEELQRPCKGCSYLGGGIYIDRTCNYIFMEGHRRPCPPGERCTVKKLKK